MPPCADDERDAKRQAQGKGDEGADAREPQGVEDDAHEVEGGLRDVDPRYGLGGGQQGQYHFQVLSLATVEASASPVNCRIWVRLSASR